MTPIYKLISFIAMGSILFFASNWWDNSQSRIDTEFIKLGGLSFYTSIDRGTNEAKSLNKPIFLYFRSETCYWCKKFEEEALSDKRVIDILSKNFVLISIDTFKQKNIANNLGVGSTPFMIFFTKDGEEISRIPGYIPTDEFLIELYSLMDKEKYENHVNI
jgi:thioredoxin-related protein